MKYEEKLLIILNAINEARKVPTNTGYIHLYTTPVNGLSDFDVNEIWDILNNLAVDEKVIKIHGFPSELNMRLREDSDWIFEVGYSYFILQLLDSFDAWYKKKFVNDNESKELINYDDRTCVLTIDNKRIQLRKDSFRTNLVALLLKDGKSKNKEWNWEEVIEKIQGISENDSESLRENKKSFYPACDGITKLVAQKTGITDLLIFNKSTVRLNPKYLSY